MSASPLHDYCPSWCRSDGRRTFDDEYGRGGDHSSRHGSAPRSPAGTDVFVMLDQEDVHGRPPAVMADVRTAVLVAVGDDEPALHLSPPEARSLARILEHLADVAELHL